MTKTSGKGVINKGYDEEEQEEKNKIKAKEALTSEIPECEAQAVNTRQSWDNQIEFLLSCVSLSVGLGNVWRFPFVAYENGGGAFLIPYLIVLILVGKPLYYMELVMGQFISFGSVKVWAMVPGMKGIGYGQAFGVMGVVSYYLTLMGLTIFYMFASFSKELPWVNCPEDSVNCVDRNTNSSTLAGNWSITAAELFFKENVTKVYENGLDDGIFAPDWKLALCLFISWAVTFLVLVKGIKSSGKAAYFTAIFPYVVLFILLGRGVTLPGALNGIKYFVTPNWGKLLEPTVWYAAVSQSFFSLAVSFGSIIMFASYNRFDHDIYRDATILSITDTFTSIIAGLTIFAVLGHSAELMGVSDINLVIKGGGTALAFISYPDVLARFDYAPQLFSVMFFMMLFSLGLGSASALTNGVITVICDAFPSYKQWQVTLVVCLCGFGFGLFYVTPQGPYLVDLIDYYAGSLSIFILACMEVVCVQWIYGYSNFVRDIEFMLNRKSGIYWKFCWVFFMPFLLIGILIYKLFSHDQLMSGSYIFGPKANAFGLGITLISFGMIPLCFIQTFYKNLLKYEKASEAFWGCFRVSQRWCPKDPDIRKKYLESLEKRPLADVSTYDSGKNI